MASSLVATYSTLLPRLILHKGNSLSPNNPKPPKTFLDPKNHPIQTITAFPRFFKVGESRVLAPVLKAGFERSPYNNSSRGRRRHHWERPAALQNQSELVPSPPEEPRNFRNSLMKFADSIRSLAFGDGNPYKGDDHEEKRWKLIEQYITSKGGVIAAEELTPYLDGNPNNREEKFMSPVLEKYEGHPVTDEEAGYVLYGFQLPELGSEVDVDVDQNKFFMEKKWEFSKTSLSERVKVVLFGFVLQDVLSYLTTGWLRMKSASTKLLIAILLQISVISLFALIPLLRFMLFCLVFLYKNARIEKRNRARQQAAQALESPDLLLQQKIAKARSMAASLKE